MKNHLTPGGGRRPRRVSLRITVEAQTRKAAERIARDYAGRKLETVNSTAGSSFALCHSILAGLEICRVGRPQKAHAAQ